jgi:hypothetical protein
MCVTNRFFLYLQSCICALRQQFSHYYFELGAVGQLMDGNQTGNQSGGVLGQLGEQAKSMLPGQ